MTLGFPIKIDTKIEKLNKLKTEGATHVELDYHCDHIGYDVSGFEIRKLKRKRNKKN